MRAARDAIHTSHTRARATRVRVLPDVDRQIDRRRCTLVTVAVKRSLLALVTCAVFGTGCPTVDLGETPVSPGSCRPDPGYYREVMWPEFFAPADEARSCVAASACHRIEDGRSALRLETADPVDQDHNYDIVSRFLDCGAPEASSTLTKPLSGVDPHGGGDLFGPGSAPEATFLEWFALE
ncbi:MAG TPA: hypothetical protein VEL05_04820 [Candidatus Acidoferrum sp.]|nr:hypothetical protein [Candidatus Acidoferrum sp.]